MRVVGGHLADDLFNFIFIASVREMSRWSVTGRHLPLGSGHFKKNLKFKLRKYFIQKFKLSSAAPFDPNGPATN